MTQFMVEKMQSLAQGCTVGMAGQCPEPRPRTAKQTNSLARVPARGSAVAPACPGCPPTHLLANLCLCFLQFPLHLQTESFLKTHALTPSSSFVFSFSEAVEHSGYDWVLGSDPDSHSGALCP